MQFSLALHYTICKTNPVFNGIYGVDMAIIIMYIKSKFSVLLVLNPRTEINFENQFLCKDFGLNRSGAIIVLFHLATRALSNISHINSYKYCFISTFVRLIFVKHFLLTK